MKKSIFLIFLLIIPIGIGLYTGLTANFSITALAKTDVTLDSSKLGDVDQYINIDTGAKRSLTYLNGYIWVANYGDDNISQCDLVGGSIISTIVLPFQPYGITTDGTYLYVSAYGVNNGIIYKLFTNGTIISNITFAVTGYVRGLAWVDGYIWISKSSPNRLFKINPTTAAISANYTLTTLTYDIAAYNGYIWCVDGTYDYINAINPASGRIMERFSYYATSQYGLIHNGTNFIMGFSNNDTLSVLDNPTDVGEVYNKFALPTGSPGDITWNGTHYFLAGFATYTIYIIHDGSYQLEGTISLAFQPLAITVMGNYLLVSDFETPYRIHQIRISDGYEVASYAALGTEEIDGLAYDGTNVWAVFDDGANTYLGRLNSTFEVEARFAIEDAGGVTYDSANNALWVVVWSTKKIVQYNLAGAATGVSFDSPKKTDSTTYKEWGITFNNKHLIITDQTDDVAYKVIISLTPSSGTPTTPIPGFELLFVLSSIVVLVGLVFIGRKFKVGNQKNYSNFNL